MLLEILAALGAYSIITYRSPDGEVRCENCSLLFTIKNEAGLYTCPKCGNKIAYEPDEDY